MMRLIAFFVLTVLLTPCANGQSTTLSLLTSEDKRETNNYVYLELLGSGTWTSVNYERIVFKNMGLRVGINGGG